MRDSMLAAIEGWHPALRAIVANMELGSIFSVPFGYLEPGTVWPPSRVTLIGDAAHAMLPTLGMGANLALNDARMLLDRLASAASDGTDVVAAIGAYEDEMRTLVYPFMQMTMDHDKHFGGGALTDVGADDVGADGGIVTTGGFAGTVLGLSCGQPRGSAEILLKEALRAAESDGATVEMVRLDDLRLPSGPDPVEPDDAWWYWERLVECDGVIISTPILSRTVTARLKLLGDRLLGPNADAAIIEQLLAVRRAGGEPDVPFRVDERVLKPRVAGFLAVGGSLTPQWKTLALPLMHTMTFSMSIAVVDQAQFAGAGTPRSIVLDDAALARAAQLGRNVAGQLGRGSTTRSTSASPACARCAIWTSSCCAGPGSSAPPAAPAAG